MFVFAGKNIAKFNEIISTSICRETKAIKQIKTNQKKKLTISIANYAKQALQKENIKFFSLRKSISNEDAKEIVFIMV